MKRRLSPKFFPSSATATTVPTTSGGSASRIPVCSQTCGSTTTASSTAPEGGSACRANGGRSVPELSRRARGFVLWSALRQLGKQGVEALVTRCVEHARRLSLELARVPGLAVLNDVHAHGLGEAVHGAASGAGSALVVAPGFGGGSFNTGTYLSLLNENTLTIDRNIGESQRLQLLAGGGRCRGRGRLGWRRRGLGLVRLEDPDLRFGRLRIDRGPLRRALVERRLVDADALPQTIDVVRTRAAAMDIEGPERLDSFPYRHGL